MVRKGGAPGERKQRKRQWRRWAVECKEVVGGKSRNRNRPQPAAPYSRIILGLGSPLEFASRNAKRFSEGEMSHGMSRHLSKARTW